MIGSKDLIYYITHTTACTLIEQNPIESVGFDGNYFYVHGCNEESGSSSDEEKTHFVLKVKTDGNVVGWKLT